MATEVAAARRRIIRRPRLTSILDNSSARIRLLVAPAGYGKTTLAREWLNDPSKRDVWYRGGPASADVAALAAGLTEAANEILSGAGKRMRDRLRATGHAEEDVDILAELFAEDIQEWPPDAWLAIDDYQFAMDSVVSEHFVDSLAQQAPIQFLITSRRRPTWATARRILYGEILEIDRRALAMVDAEAREVLGRDGKSLDELIARAKGWPAVLGLAAIAEEVVLPPEDLPATLHSYFAEEVFQAADPTAAEGLAILAIAPLVSYELGNAVLGVRRSTHAIKAGVRLGVLSEREAASFSMHPLLRDYLRAQLREESAKTHWAERIGHFFLNAADWDSAFEVASWASLRPLLELTIERGLDPLLSSGRLATVERWVDTVLTAHPDLPIVDLAESELAFRRGENDRAYVLASQAAIKLENPDPRTRAHIRAGHSALLSSREKAGLGHFRAARESAERWEHRREALIGLYFAASELGTVDADIALEELEKSEDHSADGILRLEVLRLMRAARTAKGIFEAVGTAMPKLYMVERATDPLGVTAFLHTLASSLNLAARYEEALELAERQLAFASEYRLEFPVVHAELNRAISHLGRADFHDATKTLENVRDSIPPGGDAYLEPTIRAIMCRLLCARGDFDDAQRLTDDEGETISSPPLKAEYLSGRALAVACIGESSRARELMRQAKNEFASSIEARVFAPCVESVIAHQLSSPNRAQVVLEAWNAARDSGNFDSFVCAYRAEPRLLEPVLEDSANRAELAELLMRASDGDLARRLGLPATFLHQGRGDLTAREAEVLRELEQGFSNRDIARRLFISEATVKVHLRHIYEKVGVRTRAELLARRAKRR